MTQLYYSYSMTSHETLKPLPYTQLPEDLIIPIDSIIPRGFRYPGNKTYMAFTAWLEDKLKISDIIIVRDSAKSFLHADYFMVCRFPTPSDCLLAKLTHAPFRDIFLEYLKE